MAATVNLRTGAVMLAAPKISESDWKTVVAVRFGASVLGHSRRLGFVCFRRHCGHEFLRQGRDGPISDIEPVRGRTMLISRMLVPEH